MRNIMLSEDSVRKIIKESVYETLNGLGFDVQDICEVQADMLYLRNMRKGSEEMKKRIRTSVITVLIPTALYLLWAAVKMGLRG